MDELQRRVVAGAVAEMLGRGGKTAVAGASGMSRNTVIKAEREVTQGVEPSERLRAPGGGDRPLTEKQPGLLDALDKLVHPGTRGDPMSLLRWTSKSSAKLAEDLVRQGYAVSGRTVLRLLHQLGYSLQANAKVTEGAQHPDRDGQFAVETIRRWWAQMGKDRFPAATRLLVTADAGGSNGYRLRAWKYHLARLAAETGLDITCCHYPPGTSKWNRIEHRMFSFITMNWRGRPLTTLRVIIDLISATSTKTGLTINAAYDPSWYPKGVKITDAQLATVPLRRHEWHGEWNYTIVANAQSDLA